ncbi:MAG: hypothetical protein H6755_05980 [Candidatus Omnitrophica bacterium]|nr:hypothetical protein [Candidatus Omnitrophota bacterium]MCB9747943.1 hypothetical protein [Candidatus Omnitrophota bacterium]
MNKFYLILIVLFLSGCATNKMFVEYRNYDVGRNVNLAYLAPAENIDEIDQNKDRYLFKWDNDCEFVYFVNKKTKVVESWEYVSPPDKCKMGLDWFGPW